MRTGASQGFIRTVRRFGQQTLLRRFVREQDGATVIEFAVVLAPFLALLFAIIETAMVFFAGQTLETAVADTGRLIMTGQAQKQKLDADAFKTQICTRLVAMFDCSKLLVDVRTAGKFSDADTSRPVDSTGKLTNNFIYDAGKAGDIVVVRVMYKWPILVPLIKVGLGYNLGDLADGSRLLMSTAAFRNEPF